MENKRYLTWDDIADLFTEHTGQSARVLPLDKVFEWAKRNQNKLGIRYEEKTGQLFFVEKNLRKNGK